MLEAVCFSLMPSSNVQALQGFSDNPKLVMVGREKFVEDDACPPPQNFLAPKAAPLSLPPAFPGLQGSARKLELSKFCFPLVIICVLGFFFQKKEKQIIFWFVFVLLLRRALKHKSSLKSDVRISSGQN